ncbi:aspartate aminotransferase family protein [Methylophilus sp. 3sh_L]|uniref:aspartate aminotransferase family protein n=1 Tax=Methylophilus sp. 3sh_L TaxID=3377114 RepID=UPI00398E8CED
MHLMHTYQRLPVMFQRGKGDRLWDTRQTEYIDAVSGIGVTSLGHAHPLIAEQIAAQAKQLIHTSNMVEIYWQSLLGEKLCALSGLEKAFICNSGCEANEVALKIARLYGLKKGISHPVVIVMENAFHGRTYATNAASFNAARQTGFEFEPQITGFIRVPFNQLEAIQQVAAEHTGVVAILVEPVQGEGGVQVFSPGYLQGLRALCDQHGWLLMLDEIQSGLGRTGRWFAYQHEHILPDVLTLAKALGNGVPIGACLATGAAASVFSPGGYGTTFGGNPLACRVACTVLDIMQAEQIASRASEIGTAILNRLKYATAANPQVLNVRGLGMMLGIELARPGHQLVTQALQQERLLINVTRERVIRLLPCLISSEYTLNLVIAKIGHLLAQHEHQPYQQPTMA